MKLIIDIPENVYEAYKKWDKRGTATVDEKIIANGTPLPKGHGDIVDIETLIDMFWDGNSMEIFDSDLSRIEPIIEADKSEVI